MASTQITFEDNSLAQALYGEHGKHLAIVSRSLGVKHHVRGHQVTLEGPEAEVRLAKRVLQELYGLLQSGYPVLAQDVQYTIKILQDKESASVKDIFLDTVYISAMKRRISPKSLNQKRYIEAIRAHDIVFGVGPAGTGKTYLAMAMAVAALVNNDVIRIVLARPAVEAGEKLGFLPGDLAEKVNPYLRPLYDALHDMIDFDPSSSRRPGGHRQNLPGHGHGGGRPGEQRLHPHRLGPAGGGGRGKAGLPAGGPGREGEPLFAAPL